MTATTTETEAEVVEPEDSDNITVHFGDAEVVIRRPKHSELDLGLVQRLINQGDQLATARDDIPPGPGCALKWDTYEQKLADCFTEIGSRIRSAMIKCALTFDGRPAKPSDFPPVSDRVAQQWLNISIETFLLLFKESRLEKS